MMQRKCAVLIGATCATLIASTSALATVEVLFNQISGHTKALVPPGAGLAKGTEFKVQLTSGFDRPFASPDGSKLIFTGLANLATTEDECYIVWNSNGTALTMAREGTTFGSPIADNLGLGDQRMGINNAGDFAFGADTSGATTADELIIKWNATTMEFEAAAREGDSVPGAKTELFGGAMNSAHILADGTVAFCAPNTNGTLPTSQDDFCFRGSTIVVQSGNAIDGGLWTAFNESDWWVTADGAHWMLVGDDNQATATNRILVVDGIVQAREGVPLIGSSYTSNVSSTFGDNEAVLAHDGSYMLRGHNVDGHDWVLRNGTVIAEKGAPITPGNTELYDDATFASLFFFIASNNTGDWVVGGVTNADPAANAVLVLNGTDVVAREGDPIDLDGNGLPDDDAFISIFNNDDGVLTDDMQLIFFANCVNGLGESIGQMVLRVDLSPKILCPPDIAPKGGDGQVNANDLLAVINNWGACPGKCPPSCDADITEDCVVNANDLLAVINGWGSCDGSAN